jgi:hypothetical protein
MASPVIIDGQVRESRIGPSDLFRQFGPAVYRGG